MYQKTVANIIDFQGIGLHSGLTVNMRLIPTETDQGVVFRRADLDPIVDIPVTPFNIKEAVMCTLLVSPDEQGINISTIEHLMSALAMFNIDNVIIEVDAPELPVMDGSAQLFVHELKKIGTVEQSKVRKVIKVLKTVRVEDEDKFAEVHPADALSYAFEIQWDHPVIANTPNKIDFRADVDAYISDISAARTFGFVEQLEYLHKNNLAKGASADNAVGVTADGVINEGGLRYPDEFVKHKLLDAIGDFYVAGPILGRFNCYKSGHTLNNRLLRALLADEKAWCYIQVEQ